MRGPHLAAAAALGGSLIVTSACSTDRQLPPLPPDRATTATPVTPADPTDELDGRAARVLIPEEGIFGQQSLWRRNVSDWSPSQSSPAQVASLIDAVEATGAPTINIYEYGVSFWTVAGGVEPTRVRFDDCQDKNYVPDGLYGPRGHFEDVPIPADARQAAGTDGWLSIYQPATDTLWDFWRARRVGQTWQACWGGRVDQVSRSEGVFDFPFGASASGIAFEAGAVSIHDVHGGTIDHAVALALPAEVLAAQPVPPATRTDGTVLGEAAIAEGARLRLDPALEISSLGLTPIGALIASAVQRYGFIVTDRAGTVAIPAESPDAALSRLGRDPWKRLLDGVRPYQVLEGFPWGSLTVLAPPRPRS